MDIKKMVEAKASQYEKIIKAYNDNNELSINGRVYSLIPNITHEKRVELFQYHSECQSGWRTLKFAEVEKMLLPITMCDGELLKNKDEHFGKYPQDYNDFIADMLELSVYPFLEGKITDFLSKLKESLGN